MASADHAGLAGKRNWLPLLRYSHIVSSAVREILEQDPLQQAGGSGLTPRQFHLLEFISRSGHHVDDVAKFLRVTPPAATKAVDKLERRGLVVRSACAGDRRVTLLACSENGLRLVERYRALQSQTLEMLMSGFADDEVSGLASLLERYSLALVGADDHADALCLRCSGYDDRDCPLQWTSRGCAYLAKGEP